MEKLELTANAVGAVRVQNIGSRQGWKGVCKLRCYVVWFLPVPKDGVGLERCRIGFSVNWVRNDLSLPGSK